MFKRSVAAVLIIGAVISACTISFAMCGSCGMGHEKGEHSAGGSAVKVNNTICPVTGEKVDMKNPITVEHEGKIYNLCCPMCVDEFKKNPDKYISKIKDAKK